MGNPLREVRIKAFLTRTALASRAGVSPRTVQRAELGESISDVNRERIARALGFGDRRDLFPEREDGAA